MEKKIKEEKAVDSIITMPSVASYEAEQKRRVKELLSEKFKCGLLKHRHELEDYALSIGKPHSNSYGILNKITNTNTINTMNKQDFIREFVLDTAKNVDMLTTPVTKVLSVAEEYADRLYPVDPQGKHLTICKLLRNCNLQKLISLPTEERYEYLSEVLDSEISADDLKLFSHLDNDNLLK